jgi:hypothetical protein
VGLFDEKTEGRKSRDTVPLNIVPVLVCTIEAAQDDTYYRISLCWGRGGKGWEDIAGTRSLEALNPLSTTESGT